MVFFQRLNNMGVVSQNYVRSRFFQNAVAHKDNVFGRVSFKLKAPVQAGNDYVGAAPAGGQDVFFDKRNVGIGLIQPDIIRQVLFTLRHCFTV